jgi:hypothetical protein
LDEEIQQNEEGAIAEFGNGEDALTTCVVVSDKSFAESLSFSLLAAEECGWNLKGL